MILEWTTSSTEETMDVAEALAKKMEPGMTLTLEGDLGAGKTTFTKGLALGLGVIRVVNSPTFTLIKEYQGTHLPLYHMDVYRLDEENDEDLGFDDYFYGGGVTVVEWASRIQTLLPASRLEVTITRISDQERLIRLHPYGEKLEKLCQELCK